MFKYSLTSSNKMVCLILILGVCKRLDAVSALQEDHLIDVLSGLTICTNKRFRTTMEHLKNNSDLGNLTILSKIEADSTPMEQIGAILDNAVDMYDNLCKAQIWNRTTNGRPSALNNIVQMVDDCWNCNGKGHRATNYPKPRNKALFEKNFTAYHEAKEKGTGGENKGSGGGDGGTSGNYTRKNGSNTIFLW
jgi:hypothetical protein